MKIPREKLKEKGFVESLSNIGHFNKILTSNTALIVNVKDYGKCIELVYGITTVSDAEEYKNFFDRFGKLAVFCSENHPCVIIESAFQICKGVRVGTVCRGCQS